MKNTKCIFDRKLLGAVCVALALVAPAFAATVDNGCGNTKNDRINPEIALCSTHVYNIGQWKNPSSESDKQLMRDVVALKSTVIAQQMYKQYEYMDATLKRFKTQLEKAVLTTKLQAAGADSSETSSSSYSGVNTSSFRSSDRNIFIAGVSNCNNELTNQKVFECLQNNLNTIYNTSNNGQNVTSELRKQLANDYKVASRACSSCKDKKDECQDVSKLSQRTQFQDCLDSLRGIIRTGYEATQTMQRQQSAFGASK